MPESGGRGSTTVTLTTRFFPKEKPLWLYYQTISKIAEAETKDVRCLLQSFHLNKAPV